MAQDALDIAAELGIVGEAAQIAFEQAMISHVEAHQRHEKHYIGLSEPLGRKELPTIKRHVL